MTELLTIDEVASYLKLPKSTLYSTGAGRSSTGPVVVFEGGP